jgi:uncharacterized protein DUF6602
MRADFEASAQVKQSGSKGMFRENTLKNFLAAGRLPLKYGLGTGEIVGRVRDTSRQCDVIIFDKLNGVALLYDENVQVFPIDCVYGIIEVKSTLSKSEFLDALEKIKALKAMVPATTEPFDGLTKLHPRSRPFGVIFAYSLADNSLDSLNENLREWERETPAALWPNCVCVLESGVIWHYGGSTRPCLDSHQITSEAKPMALHFCEDSLFQFYCSLHDMCTHMTLGPVELRRFYSPSEQIGKFVIGGLVEFEIEKDGEPGCRVRFTAAAIEKIVKWSSAHGRMRLRDVLQKRMGWVPPGMDESTLNSEAFLYNPDNLPGVHELGAKTVMTKDSLWRSHVLVIDGYHYTIALSGFTDSDFEHVGEA